MWITLYVLLHFQGVAEAMGKGGAVYKYDLSIPLKDLYTLVEDMRSRLSKAVLLSHLSLRWLIQIHATFFF